MTTPTSEIALLNCPLPKVVKKRRKLMHVYDAGVDDCMMACMKCKHCGHDTGWLRYPGHTVSDLKRGFPCPKCN